MTHQLTDHKHDPRIFGEWKKFERLQKLRKEFGYMEDKVRLCTDFPTKMMTLVAKPLRGQ